jgi:hypothetical protein
MIRTKYDITVQINEQEFRICVRDPNSKEKQLLEKLAREKTAIFEDDIAKEKELNAIKIEIEEIKTLLETNKQLLKEGGITDKIKTLVENKSLAKKLTELEKKRLQNSVNLNSLKISEAFEAVARERYEMLVSGADKNSLRAACEEQGVSLQQLWREIGDEVQKALEKK